MAGEINKRVEMEDNLVANNEFMDILRNASAWSLMILHFYLV